MSNKKEKIIESSIDDYKRLPKDKQMFVLGYMQGVLYTTKNLQQLDEQSLSLIDNGISLLLARQNIDKDESQQDEPLAVAT